MTDEVKENGQGKDLEISQSLIIEFESEQTIDSVILLPNSNVESYYISYQSFNGDIYVLDDVKLHVHFSIEISNLFLIRIKRKQKRNSIKLKQKRLSFDYDQKSMSHLLLVYV